MPAAAAPDNVTPARPPSFRQNGFRAAFLILFLAWSQRDHFLALFALKQVYFCDASGSPCARVQQGIVRGYVEQSTGHNVFLGVRYAASTANENRWRPPQPPIEHSGISEAVQYSPTCPQGNANPQYTAIGEDCLSLNIWSPANASNLPVMVYNYGGAMITGSNSNPTFNGSHFASSGVVFVALNHRSNMFGFPYARALRGKPQNMGILDTFAAIQYVEKNIAAFGGDPKAITFFGHSSGGVMVDYYLWNYPRTKLRAGIIQSANVFSGPNYAPEGVAFSALSKDVGCLYEDPQAELDCMRKKSLDELMTTNFNNTYQTWFAPVIDEYTRFRDYDGRYREGGLAKHVPVLVGTVDQEETLFGELVYPPSLTGNFETWAETFEADAAHIPKIEILHHYNAMTFPSAAIKAASLYANLRFYCPTDYLVDLRADQGKVWQYRWMGRYDESGLPFLGAFHGSENCMIFKQYKSPTTGATISPSAEAKEAGEFMHQTWVNFAKDPQKGPGWPKASREKRHMALLGDPASPRSPKLVDANDYNEICRKLHNQWQKAYPKQLNPVGVQREAVAGADL